MDIGLARVSTLDQNPQLQYDALEQAGCWPIYGAEGVSGKAGAVNVVREQTLAELRAGDTLTVWKLDRLGRSLDELSAIVKDLRARGIAFRSLTEQIDTSTSTGRMFFQLLGMFAEFERNTMIERVLAGKAAAQAVGKPAGGHRLYGTVGSGKQAVSPEQAAREADLLRQAAKHVLDGGSLRQLVSAWNRDNVPTKSGKGRWSETVLRRMLVTPRSEPILGEATLHKLELKFMPAKERQRMGAPAVHLLSGILRCGICENPMYATVQHQKLIYRCPPGGHDLVGCGGVSIAGPTVERRVTEMMVEEVCSPHFLEQLSAQLAELVEGITPRQLHDWRGEISDLETVLTTRYGTPEHQAKLDTLQRQVRMATRGLLQRPDLQLLRDLPKEPAKLEAVWSSYDVGKQRRVLKFVYEYITVKPVGSSAGRRFQPDRLVPAVRI
jgi:DNA invertase Pin-like site-specific DNA recombinase